jgi:hypothetical protein
MLRRMCCLRPRLALLASVFVPVCLGRAQDSSARSDSAPAASHLVLIGSPEEDRRRLAQLLGKSTTAGSLIRSASASMTDTTPRSWREISWNWLRPSGQITWNSQLAFSLNDGAQWAGRGFTAAATGGIHAQIGRVSLNLAPQIWTTENRPFPTLPPGDPDRSGFSSPWHAGAISADLPLRFGYRSTTAFDFGESALWITGKGVAAGIAAESQWWGPGQRNALLMSNNAGGIPHAFVRTATPVRTRVGDFEGRWMIGGLTESRFFDDNPDNDLRSASGAVFTFTPAADRNVTAGVARVVYAGIPGVGALPARALDAFGRWGEGSNVRSATSGRAAEQLTSLFARYVFPHSGAEAYGEWSRVVLPASIRSILLAPQFTQGFTVGMQWMTPREVGPRWRAQVEFTNLEQSPKSRAADTLSFYVSRIVPQGYTQRGQVVGAAIGPGASSQWFALDRLTGSHDLGVFVGRIRWDQDAYYVQPTSVVYFAFDVSVFSGIRGGWRHFGREIYAELWSQRRYNYLFQNSLHGFSRDAAFDKRNITLRFRVL